VPARRFFCEGALRAGESVALDERDAHKILHVLRLRDGDAIDVVDASGQAFAACVRVAGAGVRAELASALERATAATLRVDLAQGIPKGPKMDFVIEKAAELGAGAILPFYSERCAVRDLGGSKLERWRRLAKSAAAQSGRRDVPAVCEPVDFASLIEGFADYDAVAMPWEEAPHQTLREALPALLGAGGRVLVVVGPEGGFSAEEAARAVERGARLLWLGERILRSETAGLAVLAVAGYLRDL